MKDEINFSTKMLHCFFDKLIYIFCTGSIGRNNEGFCFFGQFVYFAKAHGYGSVGKYKPGAFVIGPLGHFPCDRKVVQSTENDPFLPLSRLYAIMV